jgi:hypothetical protein
VKSSDFDQDYIKEEDEKIYTILMSDGKISFQVEVGEAGNR